MERNSMIPVSFSHTFAIVFFFVVIEAKVLSKESKVNIILIYSHESRKRRGKA